MFSSAIQLFLKFKHYNRLIMQPNNQFFTIQDYQVPSWSHPPTKHYFLEVIKEGALLQQIVLKQKQFFLLGKHAQICDIVMQNPSISRKHAILQFKKNDQNAYLFDLGSTHGTFVNKRQLPSKVYHKLNIFDSIRFGNSNRLYVLRCPEIEKDPDGSDEQLTDFQKTLKNQTERILSKQQMKQKYLDLLQNDPYYKSNHALGGKFIGKTQNVEQGITWGIADQNQVYAYKNQNETTLQPQLLRRLPGLDNNMLQKIGEYEEKLQKYQEAEGQLTDLSNRQQKQYGLEEKLRDKKDKLQKNVVQFGESLEKLEDYIKLHLFGQQSSRNAANQKREKQIDTFQDDDFIDRTKFKKQEINLNELKNKVVTNNTEDYWNLKNRLEQLITRKNQYNKQLVECATKGEMDEQMDEFEKYMYNTEKDLKQQTYKKLVQSIKISNAEIEIIREQLERIRPQEKLQSIIFANQSQHAKEQIKNVKVESTLNQLEKIIQQKKNIDEEDVDIFKYYQKRIKKEQQLKRNHKQIIQAEEQEEQDQQIQKPIVKRPNVYVPRNKSVEKTQEEYLDLTKMFN